MVRFEICCHPERRLFFADAKKNCCRKPALSEVEGYPYISIDPSNSAQGRTMSRFRIYSLLIVATSTALTAEEITLRIPLSPSEEIAIVHSPSLHLRRR